MKLKPGMIIVVKLNKEEYRFLLVHTGGNGKERLSLGTPLAILLGEMAVSEVRDEWQASVPGSDGYECWLMRVELVAVEEATK